MIVPAATTRRASVVESRQCQAIVITIGMTAATSIIAQDKNGCEIACCIMRETSFSATLFTIRDPGRRHTLRNNAVTPKATAMSAVP
jgi:hypothetical protein